MREGEIVRPSPGETVHCIRSGLSGGPFVFDVEVAPGGRPPPTHTHDEGDEHVEVLEGEIVFRVNGQDRRLGAGDTLTLTPNDAHTFWNPSRTHRARARVRHGARFERFIVQPSLTALLMYASFVDPGASRATHPAMRLLAGVIAWVGRLRGVQLVGVGHETRTRVA